MVESPASESLDWRNGWKNRSEKFLEYGKQLNHPIRELIAERAAEIGGTVLDVGCATCSDYPLHRDRGTRYIGRDITSKFIERAKKRFPGVDVGYGDVLDLGFPDSSVDVVYCKDLLEHLPPEKYKQAIGEMYRVASRRVMVGFFLAPKQGETEYRQSRNRHWVNRYSRKDVVEAFAAVGADNVDITENIGYTSSALYVVDK